ncbi:MAG: phosphoglycerate dehydrogenase [Chitinophagales bacterium]
MSQYTSFPKEKIKILLLESISPSAVQQFKDADYINIETAKGAMSENELIEKLKDVHVVGVRSKTQLTARVLKNAPKLMAIGCYCIGTNQVDLECAKEEGIAVFNAPYSNTRSVAELVIAASIMLIRKIPEKDKAAHQGIWLKDSSNAHEIRGKKLGIVGYGHIGSQVSVLAEALGLKVYYYDVETKLPLGNANTITSLKELISKTDIVTLHVPATPETANLFDKNIIEEFKEGQILINYSRGNVVDLEALRNSMENGKISGAALDVFPVEPKKKGDRFETPLQNIPNVILTPHIGGSTEEAQWNIGIDVASKIIKYIETGATIGSHSIPALSLPKVEGRHRILHIHHNVAGVLSAINSTLSAMKVNILGQYLTTNEKIGYVVLDVPKDVSTDALEGLRQINHTIKVRVLY